MKDKSIIHDIIFFVFIIAAMGIMVFARPFNSDGTDDKIVGVHIKGEVNAPGYYELEYGSRIKDALVLAGRETENADMTGINLALQLTDGEEIIIPPKTNVKDSAKSEDKSGLININTADVYQLCKLDGIGEVLAGNIVSYRAEKGAFKSVEDLKLVDGIGNSKFNKIKDKITV